jgi:hypothetical protein
MVTLPQVADWVDWSMTLQLQMIVHSMMPMDVIPEQAVLSQVLAC